ncbi:MAG: DMT family transporter [Anaerolineae bacterium]|nr:DMT family transporter [Anaerolineae bacterium]
MNTSNSARSQNQANLAMSIMVFVWGFHFVVLKNGIDQIDPMTFNALRFTAALPLFILIPIRDRSLLRLSWRDFRSIALVTIIGPIGFQVFFVNGLDLTTSTNGALLLATMPTWTAVISLGLGWAELRSRLILGIFLSLIGVSIVVLGRGGSDFSLTHDDLIGSLMVTIAASIAAATNVFSKPLVDRLGGAQVAIWKYYLTTFGMIILAGPNLLTLSAADVPLNRVPNVLYSGWLAGSGGFLIGNYALRVLGPTRATSYHNLTPIIATIAGILVLGEPLTLGLIIGGPMTLVGVMTVRQNIYTRQRAPQLQHEPVPVSCVTKKHKTIS